MKKFHKSMTPSFVFLKVYTVNTIILIQKKFCKEYDPNFAKQGHINIYMNISNVTREAITILSDII